MQKPTLQTILVLIIVALFVLFISIYFPYKWEQLSNDSLFKHYGEHLNKTNVTYQEKIDTSDWKIYRDEEYRFEMKYPKNFFPTQVLQPKTEVIQCDYANFISNCLTGRIIINRMPSFLSFCLQKTSKAAAGTTYTTYNYTTVKDQECFVVSFTVAYPNCVNFLPIESQEIQEAYDKCKLSNEVTKPETINQIFSTFKFIEK